MGMLSGNNLFILSSKGMVYLVHGNIAFGL
jgi:hypothetical protein